MRKLLVIAAILSASAAYTYYRVSERTYSEFPTNFSPDDMGYDSSDDANSYDTGHGAARSDYDMGYDTGFDFGDKCQDDGKPLGNVEDLLTYDFHKLAGCPTDDIGGGYDGHPRE